MVDFIVEELKKYLEIKLQKNELTNCPNIAIGTCIITENELRIFIEYFIMTALLLQSVFIILI